MSLDVGYSYCLNLTKKEKLEIDKRVRKNRLELIFIFFPFIPFAPVASQVPFFPAEGLAFIRNNGNDGADKLAASLDQSENNCPDSSKGFKIRKGMSPTLSKVSKKIRKDRNTRKGLDKLEEQLKKGTFEAGRGAEKLDTTKTVFYMRAGGRARLFFRYLEDERGTVEIIGESNKETEVEVMANLKRNYR